MSLAAQLIQKEQDKFVTAQSNGNTAIAVTNPDGSNIFGGSPVGISSLPSIYATVGSNSPTGSAVPPNAYYVAGKNADGTLQGFYTAKGALNNYVPTDGSNILATAIFAGNKDSGWKRIEIMDNPNLDGINVDSFPALMTDSMNNVYNGSAWDRIRSIVGASGASGAGVQAVGNMGYYSPNYASLASNSYGVIQLDSQGRQYVNIVGSLPAGSNFLGGVSVFGNLNFSQTGVTSLASGQYIGIGTNSSLPSINGTVGLATGSNFIGGVSVFGSLNFSQTGVTSLASGQFVGLNPSTNYIGLVSVASINGTVTNAAGTNFIGLVSTASINGTVTNASGTNFIGLVSVASINGTVTVSGAVPAGSNYIGLVSTASVNGTISLTPSTTGGWTKFSFLSLATGAQQIKSAAGELGGWYVYNPNSNVVYVSIFDIANSSVSLGVRTPDMILGIPAVGAANVEFANGVNFATAIQIAASMTPKGGSGPSIGLPVTFLYK